MILLCTFVHPPLTNLLATTLIITLSKSTVLSSPTHITIQIVSKLNGRHGWQPSVSFFLACSKLSISIPVEPIGINTSVTSNKIIPNLPKIFQKIKQSQRPSSKAPIRPTSEATKYQVDLPRATTSVGPASTAQLETGRLTCKKKRHILFIGFRCSTIYKNAALPLYFKFPLENLFWIHQIHRKLVLGKPHLSSFQDSWQIGREARAIFAMWKVGCLFSVEMEHQTTYFEHQALAYCGTLNNGLLIGKKQCHEDGGKDIQGLGGMIIGWFFRGLRLSQTFISNAKQPPQVLNLPNSNSDLAPAVVRHLGQKTLDQWMWCLRVLSL
ncbi:putative signal peptide protein [Puccinia sorghi]|uniref:Putative signal peptide protein n=1 Tax=Puccinia sorghi TaxID=27349 RepID=A0A0L6VCF1_9BASI|nr:putative signal peptide protein [Puccinia sorghi]